MTLEAISNDEELKRAFRRLEIILQAAEGSPQAEERDALITLIEVYENEHYDFGPIDPVEAIEFRVDQGG